MKRKAEGRYELEEKRYKRRHCSDNNNNSILAAPPSDKPAFLPDWSCLPQPAIVSIFSNLNERSKSSLALVCRSWHHASRHPCLWREKSFYFGKNYNNKTSAKSAVMYVRTFGHALKRLTIVYRTLSNEAITALVNAMEKMTSKNRPTPPPPLELPHLSL